MSNFNEGDLIDSVTYSDEIPVAKRGRAANSPWAKIVDPLIKDHREGKPPKVATVTLKSETPAQRNALEAVVNRIRALGQTGSRKDVSIHVIRSVSDNGAETDISIYISDKVRGGRPKSPAPSED